MKKALIIIFVLTTHLLKAYEIPTEGAVYGYITTTHGDFNSYSIRQGSLDTVHILETLIHDTVYADFYLYGLRNENNVTYIRSKSGEDTEQELYNFNLSVGDKFVIPYSQDTLVVSNKETKQFLDGSTRIVMELTGDYNLSWIEGIGSVTTPILYFNYLGPDLIMTEFVCYSQNDQLVYKEKYPEISCDELETYYVTTDIKACEKEQLVLRENHNTIQNSISVYYELPQDFFNKQVKIELYNITGKKLTSKALPNSKGKIYFPDIYRNGVYVCAVICEGEILKTIKILKKRN